MKNSAKIFYLTAVLAIFIIFPFALGAAAIPCTSSGDVFIFCKFAGGTCTNASLSQEQKQNASAYCSSFDAQFVACTNSADDKPGVCALQAPGCCTFAQGGKIVSCSDTVAQNCDITAGKFFWANQNCSEFPDCAAKTQAATPIGCCQRSNGCSDNISQTDCSKSYSGASWVQDGTCGQGCKVTASPTPTTPTEPVINFQPVKPKLQIDIPTVHFSDIKVQGEKGSRYIDIPFLAEYISGVFNYALGFLAMLAVVMIMIGGLKYIMAHGDAGAIGRAKSMISNAVFGLILGLSSFLILKSVSPNLTELSTLRVAYLEKSTIEIKAEGEAEMTPEQAAQVDSTATGAGATITALIGGSPSGAPCSAAAALDAVNKLEAGPGVCVGPCHCSWTAVNFLNAIGCGVKYRGGGYSSYPIGAMVDALTTSGWVAQAITDDNRGNLPVGLLVTKGGSHAGVSLGNGLQFDSGGGNWSAFAAKHNLVNTQDNWEYAVANPSGYQPCARLKGEEPFSTKLISPGKPKTLKSGVVVPPTPGPNFHGDPKSINPSAGCSSTQGWMKLGIKKGWGIIIAPPANFPSGTLKNNPISATVVWASGGKKETVQIDSAACDVGIKEKWCFK